MFILRLISIAIRSVLTVGDMTVVSYDVVETKFTTDTSSGESTLSTTKTMDVEVISVYRDDKK